MILHALLSATVATHLPDTQPLQPEADFSALMVAGAHRFLDHLTQAAVAGRAEFWQRDTTSPTAYSASVQGNRQRLARILGVSDERLPLAELEYFSSTTAPPQLAENSHATVLRVRWPVLEGVHGEGLLIQPKGHVLARIIYLPDADTAPEDLLGMRSGSLDAAWLNCGAQILIPLLINRSADCSGSERLGIRTNVPHREWLYRQSFILGRHVVGYEIQKVLALVDWCRTQGSEPICVAGQGEGGLIALHAGALDERISSVYVSGYFGPRQKLWQEPIYRNVFGLLREFGDAETASLIAPRRLAVQHAYFPAIQGPPEAENGARANAAPGFIEMPSWEEAQAEMQRALHLTEGLDDSWGRMFERQSHAAEILTHLFPPAVSQALRQGLASAENAPFVTVAPPFLKPDSLAQQKRQVRELEAHLQRRLALIEHERSAAFWKPLSLASLAAFQQSTAKKREHFWSEVIGRLPDPDVPAHPRSRIVRETEQVVIHEVVLDVWQDVFAWGWLALPKDLRTGEKRPVIVCQHGLEGLPEHCFETDESTRAYAAYKAFALRLAEQGFITFAPHNLYRGKDAFRSLQRKLNPLGLTLYSVLNGQHQRILQWLKAQPFTQPEKIAFYGLSYGGKSAMRTPAVLEDYCLSICSGDFNEWVRKCATVDLPLSYVFGMEHEIWEWNLGSTYNYAEMAALIAPRTFMVERGHNDGVGVDEWVNYEFAKVRRLYNKLGIGERAEIEHFDGPHTIHGVGTFDFLKRHLLGE